MHALATFIPNLGIPVIAPTKWQILFVGRIFLQHIGVYSALVDAKACYHNGECFPEA